MELKQDSERGNRQNVNRLNRTFYGIETIAPGGRLSAKGGLNRTFYGIETNKGPQRKNRNRVLIVPFMELKLIHLLLLLLRMQVLIVPFMELKHR